jgi:hypothetical protein
VRTPIPGAGYEASLVWGEQPLNLWGAGHAPRTRYGRYAPAPLLGLMGLLGLGQNAAINRELGFSKSAMKKYWDQRAQQCTMMADEGQCLARVARHVPVTIGGLGLGLGSYEGVGQTPQMTSAPDSIGNQLMRANGMFPALLPVGLGVAAASWVVGWGMGYWWRGRMKPNRRRRVRANRRRR